MRLTSLALSLALLAPTGLLAQQTANPAGSEKLAANAPRATPGGVTFTAPAEWSLTKRDNMALLQGPEGDIHVALVDVEAADAPAAVAKAWAVYKPESKRPLRLTTPQPPREGWEERYMSKDLGSLSVTRKDNAVVFDLGEWTSEMASRKNDDGSVSFITVAPDITGLEFVVSEREGKKALVARDAQHEYVFLRQS